MVAQLSKAPLKLDSMLGAPFPDHRPATLLGVGQRPIALPPVQQGECAMPQQNSFDPVFPAADWPPSMHGLRSADVYGAHRADRRGRQG